jgi:threonine dehydratase
MFPIAQQYVGASVLVADDAIRTAQRRLWEVLRIAAEPGGATALAALLFRRYRPRPGERVAVLVCGANTTAVDFGQ